MTRLLAQLRKTILSQRLLPAHHGLVVAVSGGLDSMALLHLLHGLAEVEDWRLVVAHLNHKLRGTESDADQAFVAATAKRLGWPFVTEAVDVKRSAAHDGVSLEMAGRRLRHEFLARTARESGCAAVVLAHHADDQMETLFLRLLRGSGVEGLAGMKALSFSPADPGIRLARPLLPIARASLQELAAEERIAFREDASNASAVFLRNRVRHELLPLLRERFQPALDPTLRRLGEVLGAEADFLQTAANRWLKRKGPKRFERLHLALQRRVLLAELSRLGVAPSYELVEALRRHPNKPVMIRPERRIRRDVSGRLHLDTCFRARFARGETAARLTRNRGRILFEGLCVKWRIAPFAAADQMPPAAPGVEYFDAEKLGASVRLRYWRPGDRFWPIGMARPLKLQDFFTSQKIPRARRHALVVALSAEDEIAWVEGMRISEQFKLGPETRRCLRWAWNR